MKITIRGEKKEEAIMELWLEQEGNKVKLRGNDAKGNSWHIAAIGEDGISLTRSIGKDSEWPLDNMERLKLIAS